MFVKKVDEIEQLASVSLPSRSDHLHSERLKIYLQGPKFKALDEKLTNLKF